MGNNWVRLMTACGAAIAFGVAPAVAQNAHVVATTPDRIDADIPRVTIHADRAPLSMVLHTIARQAGLHAAYDEAVLPSAVRVTVHLQQVSALDAFQDALRGTGLVAQLRPGGTVTITRGERELITGTIIGRVTDAKTKQPIRGATVELTLGSAAGPQSATTRDDGTFRLAGVPAGVHTITIKVIGYTKAVQSVTVNDATASTVDVALEPAATALAQVVVTGTIIPTELKAVPNAITVITAKQIEERGITRIDQLFHGDVPGLYAADIGSDKFFDEVTMYSRGATALSDYSAGTQQGTNPIKTYVDGVELADPKYLSQLDPKSIERIEILTGPQASTIYGSNAINGVMQIFTKRGATTKPQVVFSLLGGWIENDFSKALTPQHDYSMQWSGIEGRISYNAGGSWIHTGAWTPAKEETRTSGFGGARFGSTTSGGITMDVTLRRSFTQNWRRGNNQQGNTEYVATGFYKVVSANGVSTPALYSLAGQTIGVTLGYAPISWWSQEFGLGQDVSDTRNIARGIGYARISDTTPGLDEVHTARQTQRYVMALRASLLSHVQTTMTLGFDAWQNLTTSLDAFAPRLTGNLNGNLYSSRQPGHNTGGFVQTQVGVVERLFFTYGFRAEWNPNFGTEAEPNYAPRYGVAYTQDIGALTAKLRMSYGCSTRPPAPGRSSAFPAARAGYPPLVQDYGNYDIIVANPGLRPERQQGGEGGLEVYFGTRGSLIITRYNQTVDDLIAQAQIDSVRSLAPDPVSGGNSFDSDGYGYQTVNENLNVGSIRNQGWELQGSVTMGPLTTHGTYSWTKSRAIGVSPLYRAFFADQPSYQPGATFQNLPEHTWAVGMTYAKASNTLGANISGIGQSLTTGNQLYSVALRGTSMRLPQYQQRATFVSGWVGTNRSYATADLMATHRFSPHVEGMLQAQNVGNHYQKDYLTLYASKGRQTKTGLRIRW